MKTITTPGAPAAAGHYSQAIVHDGLVFVSGQLPIDTATGTPCNATIEEQTELVLRNLSAILEAAGSGIDRVLRTTVYVSDIALWSRVNATYSAFFGKHRPARSVVPTRELHFGCLVEIDAIAAVSR
ncbi:MAG: Rid family detoxifying hydrolase [Thermoanaerobaculia bacterium]|nr:Rid family detoxifying hydrolase [Thermoanaerobaculia bacterium]